MLATQSFVTVWRIRAAFCNSVTVGSLTFQFRCEVRVSPTDKLKPRFKRTKPASPKHCLPILFPGVGKLVKQISDNVHRFVYALLIAFYIITPFQISVNIHSKFTQIAHQRLIWWPTHFSAFFFVFSHAFITICDFTIAVKPVNTMKSVLVHIR